MSEKTAIESSDTPLTVESLAGDLRQLGLQPGDTVLVHSSLSRLGWVCGGAVAVVESLLDVVTTEGTLVVPTHTGDLSDPADWGNPAVPEAWWETIRATMPAFRAATTPSRGMGAVPEVVRTWPGSRRSNHPHVSFAAVGPAAEAITATHPLPNALGEDSPLGRLYDLDARVLLLGVGHDSNTSLHLAQYRSAVSARTLQSGPVLVDGERQWTSWGDIDLDVDGFEPLGVDLETTGDVRIGAVGHGVGRLMTMRRAVDFATDWFRRQARASPG